ncbi:MAG: asparagine synthase (glutamine-hydrolyzing) [Coriobacteriales bacterium]|nr:asparagine synthase (glutamine-hydrolyzing) [Coriobacteriales bacterium]
MCGFIGFSSALAQREQVLEKMMQRIVHRGPDMGATFVDDHIALGFRRLSIIDLSRDGAQPMTNSAEDGNVVVVFNGEIYNFAQMRQELESLGHRFVSQTDTEVLLHGYEHYGSALPERLRGMFAFVIYDRHAGRLFGARDRFGIKPFYYSLLTDGSLLFGSEIKAFLEHPLFKPQVNEQALVPYLSFQYSVLDECFFKGVFKLPAAHQFSYDLNSGQMRTERYWDAHFQPQYQGFEQTAEQLDVVVRESVEAHRIADVPVGTFLSSGIDSSYITAALKPQKTFSVGFADEGFDEMPEARELSELLGIENYCHLVTPQEALCALEDIVYHLDEPDSNPSIIPLYFLAKLASEQVTVVLSGEGGDELFAGYEWYADPPQAHLYKKLPAALRQLVAAAVKPLPYFKGKGVLQRSSGRPEDYFWGQAQVFEEKDARAILNANWRRGPAPQQVTAPIYARVATADELAKKQYLDLNLWQPGDILLKADKMSMAHSLELRVPFLDKEVMKVAETIPSHYKIAAGTTKYVLRQSAARTLPPAWANRIKLGFMTPVRNWLRQDAFHDKVSAVFNSDYAAEFFDQEALLILLDDHVTGRANNARKVWTIFIFLLWYKRFFLDEGAAEKARPNTHAFRGEPVGNPEHQPAVPHHGKHIVGSEPVRDTGENLTLADGEQPVAANWPQGDEVDSG